MDEPKVKKGARVLCGGCLLTRAALAFSTVIGWSSIGIPKMKQSGVRRNGSATLV